MHRTVISGLACGLALLSGAAALAHQVLWTRRMVDVLGASSQTFARVVAAFFLGLALGAWLSGRIRLSRLRPWNRVVVAEVLVAALAVPILFSGKIAEWIVLNFGWAQLLKNLLPVVLIIPPVTAMGLVIPWMIQAASGVRSISIWLYAANTVGGILGIALITFLDLPAAGLDGASVMAICLNLLVAAGAFSLAGKVGKSESPLTNVTDLTHLTEPTPYPLPQFLTPLLAFSSGFAILALEVMAHYHISQVALNSFFSTAIILVLVIFSLAVAAACVPLLLHWLGRSRDLISPIFLAAGLLAMVEPFLFLVARPGLQILPYELPAVPYLFEIGKLSLISLCPLFIVGGLVFPMLLVKVTASPSHSPTAVANLFAWNGLGGWCGAELCQSWMAPNNGLWRAVLLIAATYLILSAVSYVVRSSRSQRLVAFALLPLGALFVWAWHSAGQFPQVGINAGERPVAVHVGREGVIATVESGSHDWRMLFNNSYTLGGSKAQFNQERQALLPLLLHPHPENAAALGVATGSSVAGASLHPAIRQVDAIELSPLVLDHARKFFAPFNRDVFTNSRVRMIAEDARYFIAGKRAAYDVVIGDLFLPWRTGEGRLYSLEHFRNVRASLKPDGLFCQWLPMFQLTRPQFETIARTFQQIFPDTILLRGDFYTELPLLGLLGRRSSMVPDWQKVAAACRQLRDDGQVLDPLLRHEEGVAMMWIGPLPKLSRGPINTLGNVWIEWDAGGNIIGLQQPWFIGVPCAEFIRAVHREGRSGLPPSLVDAHEAGQFFLTLETAVKVDSPAKDNLLAQAESRLPPALRTDTAADWHHWPMRVKPALGPRQDAAAPSH